MEGRSCSSRDCQPSAAQLCPAAAPCWGCPRPSPAAAVRGAVRSFLPGPPAALGHAALACQGGGRRRVAGALPRCSSSRSLSGEGPCAFASVTSLVRPEVRAAGAPWQRPLLRPWLCLPLLCCQPRCSPGLGVSPMGP